MNKLMSDRFFTILKSVLSMLAAVGILGDAANEEQLNTWAELITAGFFAAYSVITAIRAWLFKPKPETEVPVDPPVPGPGPIE